MMKNNNIIAIKIISICYIVSDDSEFAHQGEFIQQTNKIVFAMNVFYYPLDIHLSRYAILLIQ